MKTLNTIQIIRACVMILLGTLLVLWGLFEDNAQQVALGFTTLGAEPLLRARSEAPPEPAPSPPPVPA
jgi:hypothetical protein